MQSLQGRSGTAKDYVCPAYRGKHYGTFPGMIAGSRGVLLVEDVLLLINYYKSKVTERDKEGAPCAKDKHGPALPGFKDNIPSLSCGLPAVVYAGILEDLLYALFQ